MRMTHLFTKTTKDLPANEASKNAQLLIQAGYVYKVMAGVYAYTPLGLRVLEKIKSIIRFEMNKIGGQELLMSSLQKKDTWEATGRWDDNLVDIWFKTALKDGTPIGLGWSHEEPIIEMLKQYINSYKDLKAPVAVYQFQSKMRNETRAKSGIMRGREFIMKDMYSCSLNKEQHDVFYQSVIDSYKRIFDKVGIGKETHVTFASGGAFTKFSHEFQTICDAGEDIIYVNKDHTVAVNEEVLEDSTLKELNVKREELEPTKSAEIGNIFNFGIQKSKDTAFTYTNENGEKEYVYFGSYGIGVNRLMGVIVEKFADEKGIVWPMSVAPFDVSLVSIGDVNQEAEALYNELKANGLDALYDDREKRPGEKFADSDLLGMPYRVVISPRLLKDNMLELTNRKTGETLEAKKEEILQILKEAKTSIA